MRATRAFRSPRERGRGATLNIARLPRRRVCRVIKGVALRENVRISAVMRPPGEVAVEDAAACRWFTPAYLARQRERTRCSIRSFFPRRANDATMRRTVEIVVELRLVV